MRQPANVGPMLPYTVARDLLRLHAEVDYMKQVLDARERMRREAVRKCLKPRDSDGR